MKKLFAMLLTLALLVCGAAAFAEDGAAAVTGHSFEGEWIADLGDGTANININFDGEHYQVAMLFDREDYTREFQMDFIADFDAETGSLVSEEGTVMREITRDDNYDVVADEPVYENGASIFRYNEDGALEWVDLTEGGDGTLALERPIGWVDPDYVGPARHFVGVWNEERVSVEIEEQMDEYMVLITGANGANNGTVWTYRCAYDAETDSLVSVENDGNKFEYTTNDDGEDSVEWLYENGAAVFSIDGEGRLIWDDKVENAGEGRAFERAVDEIDG